MHNDPASSLLLFFGIVLLAIPVLALYLLPSIIAFRRAHPNRWLILVINFAGGLTGFGWLLTMLWATHAVHVSDDGSDGGESGLNVLANDPLTHMLQNMDKASEIRELTQLLRDGSITEAEFERLKSEIIER